MNTMAAMNINAFENSIVERNLSENTVRRTALDVSSGTTTQAMSSDCCGSNNYPTPSGPANG